MIEPALSNPIHPDTRPMLGERARVARRTAEERYRRWACKAFATAVIYQQLLERRSAGESPELLKIRSLRMAPLQHVLVQHLEAGESLDELRELAEELVDAPLPWNEETIRRRRPRRRPRCHRRARRHTVSFHRLRERLRAADLN